MRFVPVPLAIPVTDLRFARLHTSRMTLADDVDLEEFITAKDDLSGADIKAVCTEAGLLALRERRMRVTKSDVSAAREKVKQFIPYLHAMLTIFPGIIQEERGCPRRLIFVTFYYIFTSISPYSRGLVILSGLGGS